MPTAIITGNGRITIPKPIRERMCWGPGDRLAFEVDEQGRVAVKLAVGNVRRLRGFLYRPDREALSVEDMDRAIERSLRSS